MSNFDRSKVAAALGELAGHQVYIGTSSWKYDGWLGQVYSEWRYLTRGRFSKKRFESTCLAEYAETFPIVCGDFSFYQFPSGDYWHRLFNSAPAELLYAFKVPEQITAKVFPSHARFGALSGQPNGHFLDPGLFQDAFLRPLSLRAGQVVLLIFEFGTFSRRSYSQLRDFLADLDRFLGAIPKDFRYAVEIRNPALLRAEYFDCLRSHHVAHVFNSWTRMPDLPSQTALQDAYTADFTVARALLLSGRSYEQAVETFAPYREIQEPNPEARAALRGLIERASAERQAAFIFVNNRLEGNAPQTIQSLVEPA
jgi:uncharacterized protein YecE (DUF72 family)